MERYIRKHLVQGREQGGYVFRRQDGVDAILNKLMKELDSNNDGLISWGGFQNWSRMNSLDVMIDTYAKEQLKKN